MTVKLLCAWGDYPAGALYSSTAATEAAMVAQGVATATLTGGTVWPVAAPKMPPDSVDEAISAINEAVDLRLGTGFAVVPTNLRVQSKLPTWVGKHFSTSQALLDSYWIYVPIGNGYYATFAVGKWSAAAGYVPHLGRQSLGLIGTNIHHSAGSGVTKTGTWSLSSLDYVAGGSATYSTAAGDQIAFSVTGHTLVARTLGITNGGYMIVAIDGDWTAATRLPLFDAADLAAGRCRASDVGKRYINTGAIGVIPDVFHTLAEGLADVAHVVTFEATGTKPSYSSAARSFIAAVVGCSAADVGQTVNGTTRVIAMVEKMHDAGNYGASAMIYTPEVEKSVAGTWEFLGEVHAAETQESLAVLVDSVDQTSIARGAYASGAVVTVQRVSTIASTDATATPVCRKTMTANASAYQPVPLIVEWKANWLVAKRVRASYPLMMPAGVPRPDLSQVENTRFDQWTVGSWVSQWSDVQSNDGRKGGQVPAAIAIASGSAHSVKCYAALLDGYRGIRDYVGGAPDYAFLHDRTDGWDKAYFCRSTQQCVESFAVGDSIGGVVGFGVVR